LFLADESILLISAIYETLFSNISFSMLIISVIYILLHTDLDIAKLQLLKQFAVKILLYLNSKGVVGLASLPNNRTYQLILVQFVFRI